MRPSRADQPLILCNLVVGAGSYDVEVRSLEMRDRAMAARSYDYELAFSNITQTPGLEIEPNDTFEQADKLAMGQTRVGYITHLGDVDVFAFAVHAPAPKAAAAKAVTPGFDAPREGATPGFDEPAGAAEVVEIVEIDETPQRVNIHLEGNALNLEFKLVDDEGGLVANVNRAGPGADERLGVELPPGLYFVAVSASQGFNCEPYRITIRQD